MYDDVMNIALASDSRFAPGMLVTAGSLAFHANPAAKLRFFILDCGLSERDRCRLEDLMFRIRPDAEVVFLSPDFSRFHGLPLWRGCYATYGRLLLHEILPDVNYIIYADVDTYWAVDCAGLWNMRDPEYAMWAPSNSLDGNKVGEFVCPGTCLMNLEWLRRHDFTSKMREWVKDRVLTYPDMEILNGVLSGHIAVVDSMWGMQEAVKWDGAFVRPCVIHYTRNKPWLTSCKTPCSVLSVPWWRFYRRFIGFCGSPSLLFCYAKGEIKRRVFSSRAVLFAYSSLRGHSAFKRRQHEELFLSDTPRNRNDWMESYLKVAEIGLIRFVQDAKEVHLVHLYPSISDDMIPAAIGILRGHCRVICRRDIHLSIDGIVQCERISYKQHGFGGYAGDGYRGYWKHAKKSVRKSWRPTRIIVVTDAHCDGLRKAKEEIRQMVGLGIESVHITDTKDEAVALSQIYFNQEALRIFNATSRWYDSSSFDAIVDSVKRRCEKAGLPVDGICGVGSTPLGVAGFRTPEDFDFLAVDDRYLVVEDGKCSPHDSQMRFYRFRKEMLFSDFAPTFSYRGVRFITLTECYRMKRCRFEWPKDWKDCLLIQWNLFKANVRDFLCHLGKKRR